MIFLKPTILSMSSLFGFIRIVRGWPSTPVIFIRIVGFCISFSSGSDANETFLRNTGYD